MAIDEGQVQTTTVQAGPSVTTTTGTPAAILGQGPLVPLSGTASTITTAHGTIMSATPFDDPAGVLERALGRVPMPWLLAWASAIGGAAVLFLAYIVVATISYDNAQAHAILNAVGSNVWLFLSGAGVTLAGHAVLGRKT